MTLSQFAFNLFCAIAAGGVTMTLLIALGIRLPSFLPPAHGLGGLGALAVLFAANLKQGETAPDLAWWALGVFLAGLVGGLLLFRVIFKKAPLPLIAVHASAGVIGLYLLYQAAF